MFAAVLAAALATVVVAGPCPRKIFRAGDPCVQRDTRTQNLIDWSGCCGNQMTCEKYSGVSIGNSIIKVCKAKSTNTKPYEICPGSKPFASLRPCAVKDCAKTAGKCVHPSGGWGGLACRYSCVDKKSQCHKEIAGGKLLCKLLPSNFAYAKKTNGMAKFCKSQSQYANDCPCTAKELSIQATCTPPTTTTQAKSTRATTTTAASTTRAKETTTPTTTEKPTTTTLHTCGPGTRFVASSNTCAACKVGMFQKLSNHQARSCQIVQVCSQGEFSQAGDEPTLKRDRVCRSHGRCDGAAQYISVKGTATVDTECGTFTTCTAGQYMSLEGTPTSDRRCSRCPPKTFSLEDSQASCADMLSCGVDEYMSVPGTSTSDRECWKCPRGTTQPLAEHHETKDKCAKTTSTTSSTSTSSSKADAIVQIWDQKTDTSVVKSKADGIKLLATQKAHLENMLRKQTAASEQAVAALQVLKDTSTKGMADGAKKKLAAKTATAGKHVKAKAARVDQTQGDLAWVAETYAEAVESEDDCYFGPTSCGQGVPATTTTTTTTLADGTTTEQKKAGTAASSAKKKDLAATASTAAASGSEKGNSGVVVAVVVALLVILLAVGCVGFVVVRQKNAQATGNGFENPMYAHAPGQNAAQFSAPPMGNGNTGYLEVSAGTN